nr:hypothetical protein [Sphingopyxis sp. H050]
MNDGNTAANAPHLWLREGRDRASAGDILQVDADRARRCVKPRNPRQFSGAAEFEKGRYRPAMQRRELHVAHQPLAFDKPIKMRAIAFVHLDPEESRERRMGEDVT